MKFLFPLFFIFTTGFLSNPSSANPNTTCFFELNNQTVSRNFQNKIPAGVTIRRYSPKNGSGLDGFKSMIKHSKEAGACESLVISGHHTGNWFGDEGGLILKDLEKLSCNPKYKDWFSKIKALWLDGCNTVTDNAITGDTDKIIPTPDSETVRVIGKTLQSGESINDINRSTVYLSQSYTASLDKDTPLSSRYLRMFPNTQIYGFNGVAPEGNQTSQSFIATHLTNLNQALNMETQTASNPILNGLNALVLDPCTPEAIEAWNSAAPNNSELSLEAIENQDYKDVYKLGCNLILAKQVLDNPNSTEAQKALANKIQAEYKNKDSLSDSEQNILALANKILSNKSNTATKTEAATKLAKEAIKKTLTKIIEEDKNVQDNKLKYSHLLFNNIYDTWNIAKNLKDSDTDFFEDVRTNLTHFNGSSEDRIKSDKTSSIRKADYIKFYMEVNNLNLSNLTGNNSFITFEINNLVTKAETLFTNLQSPRQRDLSKTGYTAVKRTLALTVIDQLSQYGLLNNEQETALLKNKNLFHTTDPFALTVKTTLALSHQGTSAVLQILSNNSSTQERTAAVTVLTSHYLGGSDQQVDINGFNSFYNAARADNRTDIWYAMQNSLSRKSSQQRTDFIISLLNTKNPDLANSQAFVRQYSCHALSQPEKDKVLKDTGESCP